MPLVSVALSYTDTLFSYLNHRSKYRKKYVQSYHPQLRYRIPAYSMTHIAGTLHCQACQYRTPSSMPWRRPRTPKTRHSKLPWSWLESCTVCYTSGPQSALPQAITVVKGGITEVLITQGHGHFVGNANWITKEPKTTNRPPFASEDSKIKTKKIQVFRWLFRFRFGLVVTLKYDFRENITVVLSIYYLT